MFFDILNLLATSALAYGAISISTQANNIAKKSVDVTPCILALKNAIKFVSYDKFLPPQDDDLNSRLDSNNEFRTHIRAFSAAIQGRIGNQWAEN